MVEPHVGQGPVGIEAEIPVSPDGMGRAVEIRVVRHQAGARIGGAPEQFAAGRRQLREERAVRGVGGPPGPQLVEGGQVVRRVGEAVGRRVGHEDDLAGLAVEHARDRAVAAVALVQHRAQQRLRLLFVVEDALAAAPAVRGEEERHHKPLLAVGRRAGMDLGAVVPAVPGEIAGEGTVRVIHVGPGPLPDPVELRLPVQLDGNHHPVGHALGADVLVLDIRHVGHVAVDGIVDALVVVASVEKLLPGGADLRVDLRVGAPEELGEQVAAPAGRECALRGRRGEGADGHDQAEERQGWSDHEGGLFRDGVPVNFPMAPAVHGSGNAR